MPIGKAGDALRASALAVAAAVFTTTALAVSPGYEAGRAHAGLHRADILHDLAELAAIPNVGTDGENIRRVATALKDAFAARGAAMRLLEVDGANPIVFGTFGPADAEHSVTLYVHYDGQPVEPENWASPPFEPTLRTGRLEDGAPAVPLDSTPLDDEWRLYARGTSDDRAPAIALLHALDALAAAGIEPSVRLKFFFEGEEEMGSPNLARHLDVHRALLESDLWIFLDGPKLSDGRQPIYLGARGVSNFDLTVYGAGRVLHSGHFGNFAPNPIHRLAELIAGMRAADGIVAIDGFYDDVQPISERERTLIAASPDRSAAIEDEIGIAAREKPGWRIEEAVLRPALNILGIRSGAVKAEARNAIPASATATIGIRTVPKQRFDRLRPAIEAHIRGRGYHLLDREPTPDERRSYSRLARIDWSDSAYEAVRTPADTPAARAMTALLGDLVGEEAATVVGLGGSLPFAPVVDALGVPVVVLPIANADNNQHAPNENIRLGNLYDAVALYAGLIERLGPLLAVEGE